MTSYHRAAQETMGLRSFLRGGYQHIKAPTMVTNQSGRTVFTVIPGRITTDFVWSDEEPIWLKKGAP